MLVTYLILKTSLVVYVLLVQVSSSKSHMLQSVFSSVICFILIRTLFIIFRVSGPSNGSNLYPLAVYRGMPVGFLLLRYSV